MREVEREVGVEHRECKPGEAAHSDVTQHQVCRRPDEAESEQIEDVQQQCRVVNGESEYPDDDPVDAVAIYPTEVADILAMRGTECRVGQVPPVLQHPLDGGEHQIGVTLRLERHPEVAPPDLEHPAAGTDAEDCSGQRPQGFLHTAVQAHPRGCAPEGALWALGSCGGIVHVSEEASGRRAAGGPRAGWPPWPQRTAPCHRPYGRDRRTARPAQPWRRACDDRAHLRSPSRA